MDIIKNNLEKRWSWGGISLNPNLEWNMVLEFNDKDWCWGSLSGNPAITMEIIKQNPNRRWWRNYISENSNFSGDIFEFDKLHWKWKYDWGKISLNPNITLQFIEKYIDKIHFGNLSSNIFTKQNNINKIQMKKTYTKYCFILKKKIYSTDIKTYIITVFL
jgi:hypothetical protein